MKLEWKKDDRGRARYIAESMRYRFIIMEHSLGPWLGVQHIDDDSKSKLLDERRCRSVRSAQRVAQRFEDSKRMLRKLR